MSDISYLDLAITTTILGSRLTRPTTLDIVLMDPSHELRDGPKIDTFLANAIGVFEATQEGGLRFYLTVRSRLEGLTDHVFVFYLNEARHRIDDREIKLLAHHIPKVLEEDSGIKRGVVNVFTDEPRQLHLSSLMSAVDHMIGRGLVSKFMPVINVKVAVGQVAIGPLANCDLSHCDGRPKELAKFRELVASYGSKLQLGGHQTIMRNPEVVLIRDKGHLLGCFYNKDYHSVNYLVSHRNQFLDEESYDRVKVMTANWFDRSSQLTFHVTRFYPNTHRTCYDELVLMAWELVLHMRPHVLITIRENELQHLRGNQDKLQPKYEEVINRQQVPLCQTPGLSQASHSSQSSQVDLSLLLSSQQSYPREVLHSTLLPTYDYDELWTNNKSTLEDVSRSRRRIRDSIVPPVHELEPYMDFTQGYLKVLPSYEDGIKLMGQIWARYCQTYAFSKLHGPHDVIGLDYKGAQFLICPIDLGTGDDQLVVVDTYRREWIHLDIQNRSHKDSTYLDNLIAPHVRGIFSRFATFIGRAVRMPCVTHEEYPRVHLLMALYTISRLFQYATMLPQVIVYKELELREYARNICSELQIVNALHNVAHKLIDDQGYPMPTAMQSMTSPLKFEKRVVAKDQCMFCKKRYAFNLGRHMAAAHGGQAGVASRARLEPN